MAVGVIWYSLVVLFQVDLAYFGQWLEAVVLVTMGLFVELNACCISGCVFVVIRVYNGH